ncbi:MAG: septation ring formation regulator EzrA [Bacilli bacterium]
MNDLTLEITTYFLLAIFFITIVLNIISYFHNKKIKKELAVLELNKNKIISVPLMSELSKVEALVKNEKTEEKYQLWRNRFDEIKNIELSRINDMLLEADFLLEQKNYKDLLNKVAKIEIKLYEVKTKTNFLLEEIQEITLSEERNREIITKLKSDYRELLQTFINSKEEFGFVMKSVELQFENIEKRFVKFENAMDNNDYEEVNHIVKALDDMINHMKVVVEEVPAIVLTTESLIPKKIEEINKIYEKMRENGFQLDYLNVEYNLEEINKKINNIVDRVKVLNLEEVLFELKTFLEYFDTLFNDFEREKLIRKVFEENVIEFKAKLIRLDGVMKELYKKIEETKYNYTISKEEIKLLDNLNDELIELNDSFNSLYDTTRTKSFPYSKLNKELEILNNRVLTLEEELDDLVQTLGNMQDDEKRAKEQVNNIKALLKRSKYKIRSYKLPLLPNNYFVELKEASAAVEEINKELDRKPIDIETLNTRVDTARDLAFKLYNTTNEMMKTVMLAEMAIIYGNRYRSNKEVIDEGLKRAELAFTKGEYKKSLEITINTIEIIEPGIYRRLLNLYDKKV